MTFFGSEEIRFPVVSEEGQVDVVQFLQASRQVVKFIGKLSIFIFIYLTLTLIGELIKNYSTISFYIVAYLDSSNQTENKILKKK